MIELLIYCAVVFGISWTIGFAHISHPIRAALQKGGFTWVVMFLECVGCTGFWLGVVAFFLGRAPLAPTSWWIAGFFTATTNLVLAHLTGIDRD